MKVLCLHGESENVRDRQREEGQQMICEDEIQAMLLHPSTLAESLSLLRKGHDERPRHDGMEKRRRSYRAGTYRLRELIKGVVGIRAIGSLRGKYCLFTPCILMRMARWQ